MQDAAPVSAPTSDGVLLELDELRRRVEKLDVLSRHLAASAVLQDLRTGAQATQAHLLQQQLRLIQSSAFWRATWPLRLMLEIMRGMPPGASREALFLRRVLATAKRRGMRAGLSELSTGLARWRARRNLPAVKNMQGSLSAQGSPAETGMPLPCAVLAPNVLIIAELSLPQCAKYRVWQRQESFRRLGVPCRVVDWRDALTCTAAAALATQIILYRVPGYPVMLKLIAYLHALRLPVAWEVDDLIFDQALFLKNRNVHELDEKLRESIISGVDLYRSAMLACGSGIASTSCLAETMRSAGLDQVVVVQNALDADTLSLAESLRARRRAHARSEDDGVLIAYGSGTKTHDADFRQAAPALARLLSVFPKLRLRIVGELTLPVEFEVFAQRVERLPPTTFVHFLHLLADSDISIAPLEPTLFNDAKSNIKFLEAAILGLPSVCSPRAEFARVLEGGSAASLADDEEAWFLSLSRLIQDPSLRHQMGQAALRLALARYDPDTIARNEVAKLLSRAPDTRRAVDLRVLFANIYYAPRSFGGATLVVQEMARRLRADPATEVHILTSLPAEAEDQVLTRNFQDGLSIYSLPVADGDVVAEFDNPSIGVAFGQILDAVQPHVVHLHAMQWLSASIALACIERSIPYVVTLHDAWWLCARQFMVTGEGHYCFQEKIDLHVCQNCMPGAGHLDARARLLRTALDGADLLLSPSESHRKLYLANGIPPEKIQVASNGIRKPAGTRTTRKIGPKIRFAYVGGEVEVKGFSIVKRAFEALARSDWELLLVDNTQKLGFSSMQVVDWKVKGTLHIVPAYAQDGIDEFFAGIDVLLFPSQWKESFGLTVREALARDIWVIATEGGGPGEAILDGVNGFLIPLDGRAEPLRLAVERLLDSPQLLEEFHNPAGLDLIDYDAQAASLRATLAGVVARHRASDPKKEVVRS